MEEQAIGYRLIHEGILTEEQLNRALERQKLYGGRLGNNLIELKFINNDILKSFFKKKPGIPRTVEGTALTINFIGELILKNVLFMGDFFVNTVSEKIKLPSQIIDQAIQILRREHLVEVKGSTE